MLLMYHFRYIYSGCGRVPTHWLPTTCLSSCILVEFYFSLGVLKLAPYSDGLGSSGVVVFSLAAIYSRILLPKNRIGNTGIKDRLQSSISTSISPISTYITAWTCRVLLANIVDKQAVSSPDGKWYRYVFVGQLVRLAIHLFCGVNWRN